MKLNRYSSDEIALYESFPRWLLDSYKQVKNNGNIQKHIMYIKVEDGYLDERKKLNIILYIEQKFKKLYNCIINYNKSRKYQTELLNELYKVIHKPINYKRCIKFIYDDLVNLEIKQANRLEIQDILNTTHYREFVVAFENVNEYIIKINKLRGRGHALSKNERLKIKRDKELDIINYVGSLINKNPLKWEDIENAREVYKLVNYSYINENKKLNEENKKLNEENKKLNEEIEKLNKEIKRLEDIILEIGGFKND